MKTLKLKKILASLGIFLFFSFFAFQAVSAAGIWDAQIGAQGQDSIGSWFGQSSGTPDIKITVYKIINFVISLLAIIFLVLTIIAGFLWMTAGGDSKKVESATGYLKSAIIGLIIILISKGLTIFIFKRLINVTAGTLVP
ncbi:MAG: hypothetical protein NT165_02525 [Candidatus Falkowbacteria bacterium]|nr:hypothetical protein [Candidatus Falkowbacteria bacterium]